MLSRAPFFISISSPAQDETMFAAKVKELEPLIFNVPPGAGESGKSTIVKQMK